jgi:uncharacterized protein YjiS (DUF1127 family)
MNFSFAARLLTVGRKACMGLGHLLSRIWMQLQRWWELAEQRRKLALLDEYALHDLGLSRADAICESERPFWDDPLKCTEPSTAPAKSDCPSAVGRLAS